MFNDPRPSRAACPIDSNTKEWIDARASWIVNEFGWQRISSCPIVLPTDEFFFRNYRGTETDARAVLDRMCEFLGIDSRQINLRFFAAQERADGGAIAAGMYDQKGDDFDVWIEWTQVGNQLGLAATLAHELCHVHLLGHRRVTEETDDHEPLTDMTTVFLGLGVITGNAVLREENWHEGHFSYSQMKRHGYSTLQMYGYALALHAHIRLDNGAQWSQHLRPDVRDAFQKSLNYFSLEGPPDLHSVKSTQARPTHLLEWLAEQAADRQESASETDTLVCTFCGAGLPDDNPENVCSECSASIEENQAEIEIERREAEIEGRRKQVVLRVGCSLLLLGFLVATLASWLGILD